MKYSGIFDSNGEKLLSYSREKLMNYFDLKDFLPPILHGPSVVKRS